MNIIKHKEGAIYTKPCLVEGMSNDEYHAHQGISNSGLKLIEASPAHYAASCFETTRAMEIGTAIHCAILEPERFASDYILIPEVKDRRQPEYKSAVKNVGSERVLVGKEVENVLGMVDSIYSSEYLRQQLSVPAWRELSVFAIDPATGELCKCRFDFLSHALVAIDLKKTQDARADAFSRAIYNYAYHQQHAFYCDVFFWATGVQLETFKFLAIEEKPPHGRKLYRLGDESIEAGRNKYRRNMETYAECKATGVWPLYECEETEVIDIPSWALFAELDSVELNLEGAEYV